MNASETPYVHISQPGARLLDLKLTLAGRDGRATYIGGGHVGAAANIAHSGADGGHFHPFIVMQKFHVNIDANHAIGAQLIGLELHAAERQFAGLVHKLRILLDLALEIGLDPDQPVANRAHRVDAVADHQAHRLEALVDHQPELLAGEIRSKSSPAISRSKIHGIAWFSHNSLAFLSMPRSQTPAPFQTRRSIPGSIPVMFSVRCVSTSASIWYRWTDVNSEKVCPETNARLFFLSSKPRPASHSPRFSPLTS